MRTGTQVARKHGHAARRGLAMVAVLLVLMALFVLSAPFLVTVRNADQASAESADRSVLRISLDAAARHAAAGLAGSHPALDATPYFDDLDELTVTSRFPKEFLATDDPSQVMWDLEAEDVAAKVDLSSASPHVLANLIGGAGRLSATCTEKDSALEVSASEGFLPEGVVLVDDELMGYAELGPSKLGKLARGLLVQFDAEGKPLDCGPTPPAGHEVGAFVIDQRAWALCEWRIATGKLRAYEGIEQVREAKDFVLAPELGREAYLALARSTSTFGHVRAGARKVGQLQYLRVIDHRVEAQLARPQRGVALAEIGIAHHPGRHDVARGVQRLVGVPLGADANAAKAPAAGRDLRVEHLRHFGADADVRGADDACTHTGVAEGAGKDRAGLRRRVTRDGASATRDRRDGCGPAVGLRHRGVQGKEPARVAFVCRGRRRQGIAADRHPRERM